MSVKSYESLYNLEMSRIISKNQNGLCSLSEPEDTIDLYIDFIEKINPYDWGNDYRLIELVESVFIRKEILNNEKRKNIQA